MGIKAILNFLNPSLKTLERMEERGELNEEDIKPVLDILMEAILPPETKPKTELSILLNELIHEQTHGMIADVASRILISECERDPLAMRNKLQQVHARIGRILIETQSVDIYDE